MTWEKYPLASPINAKDIKAEFQERKIPIASSEY